MKQLLLIAAIPLFFLSIFGCDSFLNPDEPNENNTSEQQQETVVDSVRNPTAEAGSESVTISWGDPVAENTNTLHIEISWSPGSETPEEVDLGQERFTVTGLQNGTEYTFTIVMVDNDGDRSEPVTVRATPSAPSDELEPPDGEDTTPPDPVSDLAEEAGDGQVTLQWSDPPDTDGDLENIEISWTPGSAESQSVVAGTGSLTVVSLQNGTEYTFSVITIDSSGNRSEPVTVRATPSAPSDELEPPEGEDTTPPGPVSGLAAEAGGRPSDPPVE